MASEIRRLTYPELAPALQDALAARVRRLGYLGEFFAVGGHQPAALLAFHGFTEALKHALPDELTETVALTVATRLANDYERVQHERLSVKLGFSREWVAAASGRGDPTVLSTEARLAQGLTLALLEAHGHGTADRVAAATAALGEETTVGLLLLVGRYVAHAVVSNALGFAAPVGSIFEEVA